MVKLNNDTFISRASIKHGGHYDYSLVRYKDAKSRVVIKCPIHGIFEQLPRNHLYGKGCRKCSYEKRCLGSTLGGEAFVKKSKEIHGNKYGYSLVRYVNNATSVIIECPEHGIFHQTPATHMRGSGCQKCGINSQIIKRSSNTVDFITKASEIHSNEYDYSRCYYINSNTNVEIICPIHDVFEQLPHNHLYGKGCEKCGKERVSDFSRLSTSVFKERAEKKHGDKYDYSEGKYTTAKTKVNIVCDRHGAFTQKAESHLHGSGCPICSNIISKGEDELKDFFRSLSINLQTNNRTLISPLELDIHLRDNKLAIEYNGLYWHSEEYLGRDYHLNKTIACERRGIQLIHIFEDEWLFKKDIVKSRLLNLIGLTPNKIYARKTQIKEVSSSDVKDFLKLNHIQGHVNSSIKLGLYHQDELVSLMTFGGLRKSMGSRAKDGSYELLRFCNKLNTSVVGAADKLLKHFIRIHQPSEIISYADRRWSQGHLYEKLGFEYIYATKPNFAYILKNKREYRFKYRKDILIKEGYDKNKSEYQIMLDRGIYRIYDSGNKKYKMTLKDE